MVTVNIAKMELNNVTENFLPKLLILLNERELKGVGLTKPSDRKNLKIHLLGNVLPSSLAVHVLKVK